MGLEGMPLFLIELGIGQRLRTGPVGVWNAIHPYLGGVGVSAAIVSYLVGLYYNVILTWCIYYLWKSFSFELPWTVIVFVNDLFIRSFSSIAPLMATGLPSLNVPNPQHRPTTIGIEKRSIHPSKSTVRNFLPLIIPYDHGTARRTIPMSICNSDYGTLGRTANLWPAVRTMLILWGDLRCS
jgi:hypothetical protein